MRNRDEQQWHVVVKKDPWRISFQIVDMCVTADGNILLLSSDAWGREYQSNGKHIGIAGRGVSDNPTPEQRLASTPDGTIWLIHREGVWVLDSGYWKQNTSFRYAGLIDVVTDSTGALWWIDWEYLNKYNVFTKENTRTKFIREDNQRQYLPKKIAIAPDGHYIWRWAIMDDTGYLLKIDSNYSWSVVSIPEFITSATFTDIAVDGHNAVWISTHGHGLFRGIGDQWEQFTASNGLSTSEVDIVRTGPDGMYAGFSDRSIAFYDGETWRKDPLDIITGIEEIDARPEELSILGVFPNPFNSSITIQYHVPHRGMVTVAVYSITGQKIVTLINTDKNTGIHSVTWNPVELASGEYLVVALSGKKKSSKKVTFVK